LKGAFDIISHIEKDDIIKLFSEHEANRHNGKDDYAHGRIEALKKATNVTYSK